MIINLVCLFLPVFMTAQLPVCNGIVPAFVNSQPYQPSQAVIQDRKFARRRND